MEYRHKIDSRKHGKKTNKQNLVHVLFWNIILCAYIMPEYPPKFVRIIILRISIINT